MPAPTLAAITAQLSPTLTLSPARIHPSQASRAPEQEATHPTILSTTFHIDCPGSSDELSAMEVTQKTVPIQTLPVELLSRIFLLGYSDGVDPARPFKRKAIEGLNFEVIISHVCSHWRGVALRTPGLWTSLRMRKPSHLERGKEFVKRSRYCLLDVMFDFVARKDHIPGRTLCFDHFHEAFDIAEAHAMRWRSLLLRLCDLECKGGARARLHGCAPVPMLQSLQLWHLEDWGTSQNLFVATAKPPVQILNNDVPSLKNLSLVGVNLAWSQEHYLADLEQIEFALHSEGVRPSVKEWEELLRASPNLWRLSLHYSGPRVEGAWTASPIPLAHLSVLSLTDMDPTLLCSVMQHLTMPTLRTLEMELPEQDFTAFVDLISDAQAPYFPILDDLHISALDCSVESWGRFLRTIPKLSYLEADFRRIEHDFFDELFTKTTHSDEPEASTSAAEQNKATTHTSLDSVPESSNPFYNVLLPRLRVLKVAGLSAQNLLAYVTFRKTAGYPVPRLVVHDKMGIDDMNALQEARVDVEYYQYSDDDDDDEEGEEEDGEEEDCDEAGGEEDEALEDGDEAEVVDDEVEEN
ncbi:hypothetical protein EVG20_g2040 [Dentipellis fragilis]|uniref:Uncharacterized protein n=1 Tax=Dentipellis fragilis TaxID=205917 RepID=A0A4Y9ZAC3_9AGAM|nr:hypothetical protein EVG20_g2040 [Dentipellis fragilis]